jgi:predicted nucleotidyltransferase
MGRFGIKATQQLPDHDALLDAILSFFRQTSGIIGAFLSGSTATGQMDVDSDLDVGIVFQGDEQRTQVWEERWEWQIAPWFHRFDADHIKSHFVIYLFESALSAAAIRADINLYLVDDLPPAAGGPFVIAWDKTGALREWQNSLPAQEPAAPDWSGAVHEDERFWAWLVYLYNHVHRGEWYHCAYEFPALRDILEQWTARLAGHARFASRRLEGVEWAERLLNSDLFPRPDQASLKASMLAAIELQLELRSAIEELGVAWKTELNAIDKVTRLVQDL